MGKKILRKAMTAAIVPSTLTSEIAADVASPVIGSVGNAAAKITSKALSSAVPPAPPIEVPQVEADPIDEVDPDEDAEKATVRRRRASPRTRTLLSSGLGGGNATVGRPTLLGGG